MQVESNVQIRTFARDQLQPTLRFSVQGKGIDTGRRERGVVFLKTITPSGRRCFANTVTAATAST
ncbi:hypothetical protein ALO36_103355 [Pseudomonas syringae pv. tomato]|uniref:Uncharacterized protein n=1 Tax=Pseudomonas syringae pv. apii TaxID=81036 RepID=A0A3M3N6G4_9PSED|nr:Unknown protein sequence [Pseudomonas syringae pv. maculicola str. M6]KPB92569.1 Unknown protein sequence [Pseudomonas syringae pv. maculicola]KPY87690.1 hypothetical protein ALO36_103355 [Pseudomonas syringae pv. tomato]RMN39772.1 hypothetical protein ALQ59_102379 [Pseudomonas syringae pv. apii]KPX75055.1 hypothetical protein ALO84_101875 [Pseudomonas syringae pv. maculicola]